MKKTIKHPSVFRSTFYVLRSTIYVFRSTFYANVIVFALILALFSSCSKFEDGPKISLRSIEKRIYGTYRIEYLEINGTDMTSYWNQYYDITFKFYVPQFEEMPKYQMMVDAVGEIDSCGSMTSYSGYTITTVRIENDNVTIPMYFHVNDTNYYPGRILYPIFHFDSFSYFEYSITRLTNDEMWFMYEGNAESYKIHFKE